MKLIRILLAAAFDHTETWREDHLGANLAYLCDAIANNTQPGCHFSPEMTDQGSDEATWKTWELLKQWFPEPKHPIWRFVR